MRKTVTASICILLVCGCSALSRTLQVPPGSADAVSEAVSIVSPGDTILLMPGVFSGTIEIRASGEPEKPIIIRGSSGNPEEFPVIDGGAFPDDNIFRPAKAYGRNSGSNLQQQGIRIEGASWVVIENIRFVNCWTDVITAENATYITIRNCIMDHCGKRAIQTIGLGTHHILVEDCEWTQNEKVWTEWDWEELHTWSLWHYNGGFYAGDGAGGAIIRRNKISYAYNGLQWFIDDSTGQQQSNIEIYGNRFSQIRDNIIEPEVFTYNLHVYHNQLNSCPRGAISIDGVAGGEILLYGNTSRSTLEECADDFWWTMFKFYYRDTDEYGPAGGYQGKGFLDQPLRIYHNSWLCGQVFADDRRDEDHIRHLCNAIEIDLDLIDSHDLRNPFGFPALHGADYVYDHDCLSGPWPSYFPEKGLEEHGIATDPGFVDADSDDFRLHPDSPCIDAGTVLPEFTQWFEGSAPDIGAYEGDLLVYGKPFKHKDPPGGRTYVEKPRIVRCFARGRKLAIFFSTDLVPRTITAADVHLVVQGSPAGVLDLLYPGEQRIITLQLDRAIPHGAVLELAFKRLPIGLNGQTATMWGADLLVIRIPEEATLLDEMAVAFPP